MINSSSFFYHIYPLGFCGCPKRNDFKQMAGDGLKRLAAEIPQIASIGINAILIGPVFESSAHGYDTVDYFFVDRRLGTNDDLKLFVEKCHSFGISVVLDAVFNHSGRDFFAFKDLQQNGQNSPYKDWYQNIRFDSKSPLGDNFTYENWAGCFDLVKYNLENSQIRGHLFSAAKMWIQDFGIDGFRLDAADRLSFEFMKELRKFTKSLKPDFWLMGEVVHGDYNSWVNDEMLDSVTNYQLHKGLWSSFNDKNFFEVAYSLNSHFGSAGQYRQKALYNFLDNHDVNRVASALKNPQDIFSVYALLFAIPGIPSIYYGSEIGIRGKRNAQDDFELRPALFGFSEIPDFAKPSIDGEKLKSLIKKLAQIRASSCALQNGNYKQIFVANKIFCFLRQWRHKAAIAIFSVQDEKQKFRLEGIPERIYTDAFSTEKIALAHGSEIEAEANSFRILLAE